MISSKGQDCEQLLQSTFSWDMLKAKEYDLWFSVITLEDLSATEDFVSRNKEQFPQLITVKDKNGRSAYDMATTKHKTILRVSA
jgi:hypothetical protein